MAQMHEEVVGLQVAAEVAQQPAALVVRPVAVLVVPAHAAL